MGGVASAAAALAGGVTGAGRGTTCVAIGATGGGSMTTEGAGSADGIGAVDAGSAAPEEFVTAARGNCSVRVCPPPAKVTLRP